MSALRGALVGLLSRETDTLSLAVVRIGLVLVLWARWAEVLRLFWYRDPTHVAVGTGLLAASLFLALGLWTRVTSVLTFLGAATVLYQWGHIEGNSDYVHHNTQALVIALGILALTPSGRSLSLDRWWQLRQAERRGEPPPSTQGPTWAMSLFAVHLCGIYLWGAINKCNEGYLYGVDFEQQLAYLYTGSHGLPSRSLRAWLAGAAIVSVVLEFYLAFAFFFRRHWLPAVLLAVPFHALLYAALPVATYSALMFVLFLAARHPEPGSAMLRRLM